ncbi:unnamed protein product [Brassica oleracea]
MRRSCGGESFSFGALTHGCTLLEQSRLRTRRCPTPLEASELTVSQLRHLEILWMSLVITEPITTTFNHRFQTATPCWSSWGRVSGMASSCLLRSFNLILGTDISPDRFNSCLWRTHLDTARVHSFIASFSTYKPRATG